jgi:GntP family gluconate:H+ symporter
MQPPFLQTLAWLMAGLISIVILTVRFRLHAFFALLFACLLVGLGAGLPLGDVIRVAKEGFGDIMGKLGWIIVLGTTLGVVLENRGSTRVMAGFILRVVGERSASLAMSITGFVVGLPIFCDSGFIVLSSLSQTLATKTRIPLSVMAVSLATGLYSVHCLIPPHPGATSAAATIGLSIGALMLAGIGVAIPAAVAGHLWARFAGRKSTSPVAVSLTPDAPLPKGPSVFMAFLPVIVPIVLIAGKSLLTLGHQEDDFLSNLGTPEIALLIGVVIALLGGGGWTSATYLLRDAVEKAGGILVIIGVGGSFGAILAATKLGLQLGAALPLSTLGIAFPFLLTAGLKTAQGSSTVALITAASIMKPLLPALGLATGNGPLLCVLSMGCGSMVLSHANDAYFWVISRFTGLDLKTMLKVYTVGTLIMGLSSFLVVYLISLCIS